MPQRKKGAAAPKKRKSATSKDTKASQGAKKQMWAVVLFSVGILMLALTFIEGEKLWLICHNWLFGLLGWSAYFVAPLALYIAVIAAMDKPLSSIKAKLWQAATLILMISGANLIFSGLPEKTTFVGYVKIFFDNGVARKGGGVFGGVFGWPLTSLLGSIGAKWVISLSIFVFVMLVTGSTLLSLYHMFKRPVKEIEEAYTAHLEEKAARPAPPPKPAKKERVKAAAAIDIDISGDSNPDEISYVDYETPPKNERADMPGHPVTTPVEPPPSPAVDEAAENNRAIPFVFGEDSPVEYIEVAPVTPVIAIEKPTSPHPLADDIEDARREEIVLNSIKSIEEPEIILPELEDDFLYGAGPSGAEVSEVDEAEPPLMETSAHEEIFSETPDIPRVYKFPPISLLSQVKNATNEDAIKEELKSNSQILEDTLRSFGVQTRVVDICRGPAVTRYEIQPSAGVKISKITGLADDIALSLAAAGIRIEAPIPNKSAVGIEVPNRNVSMVGIRDLIDSPQFKNSDSSITVALGRDIAGNIVTTDIGRMPHMLVAGATGSGKSVCINSIIISLLYKSSPDEVKFLMIDPKMVELGIYNGIPHLLIPVVTDPKKAAGALSWAVSEMLKRYESFKVNAVRDIAGYNQLAATRDDLQPMPKIVIIIDELADLMMTSPKEVENAVTRLAQMARAAGMHLIIATQRPSVSVITGDIKVNIPSRIAFAVSSQFDSRTILDMGGAERLLGRGDMLFYPVGNAKPVRVQGCFVSDKEVESVVDFIKEGEQVSYDQTIVEEIARHAETEKNAKSDGGGFDSRDEMFPQAVECVVEAGQASTSQLQRRLSLGYARAARIIDQLEERGIVGPSEGSKPRQVLITKDQWIEMKLNGAEEKLLNSETPL